MTFRTLRARLTGTTVGLLAAGCLLVGLGCLAGLRMLLLGQVDADLSGTGARASAQLGTRGGDPLAALGQPAGTLVVRVEHGRVTGAALLTTTGTRQQLPATAATDLATTPPDGRARTVTLDGPGDYRVSATTVPGSLLVTGLPLAPVTDTLTTVAWLLGGATAVALTGAAVVSARAVRHALAPLHRVAATAARVSELPLDRAGVTVRVPVADAGTTTEAGRVGAALNLGLDRVDTALHLRRQSEARQRRFAADASHELRTPLAAVHGYAELAARGEEHLPVPAREALRGVRAESARLGAALEHLLRLARQDPAGQPEARAHTADTQPGHKPGQGHLTTLGP